MEGWWNLFKNLKKEKKQGEGPSFPFLFFLYFIFFFCLFLPYPLEKSLPGNCDTWLAVALSNTYLKNILSFFGEGEVFSFLYPVKNVFAYGESSPGLGLLFILCKVFLWNDIWAYFLYLVLQFCLTSFSFLLMGDIFVKHRWSSFLGGLFFCTNNFVFSNIDDTLIIFYFIPFLTLFFFYKSLKTINKNKFIISSLILGITPYFSFYLYFYLWVILFITIYFYRNEVRQFGFLFIFSSFFLSFLISFPIIFFYLQNSNNQSLINPYNLSKVIESTSLHGEDFLKALPENLLNIKSHSSNSHHPFWSLLRRHAWIGSVLPLLGIFGLFLKKEKKINRSMIVIGLVGLLLSLGPTIYIFDFSIPSPTKIFYDLIPLSSFLRVPLRGFFIALISLCFFASFSLKYIFELKKYSLILPVLIVSLYIVENIPFPLKKYPSFSIEEPPPYYKRIDEVYKPKVVLNLPSLIRFDFLDSDHNIYSFNREVLYMNWQTKLSHNVVNGVNGYLPKERLKLQGLLLNLNKISSVNQLKKMGIDMIVIHKNLFQGKREKKIFYSSLFKGFKIIENEKTHTLLSI